MLGICACPFKKTRPTKIYLSYLTLLYHWKYLDSVRFLVAACAWRGGGGVCVTCLLSVQLFRLSLSWCQRRNVSWTVFPEGNKSLAHPIHPSLACSVLGISTTFSFPRLVFFQTDKLSYAAPRKLQASPEVPKREQHIVWRYKSILGLSVSLLHWLLRPITHYYIVRIAALIAIVLQLYVFCYDMASEQTYQGIQKCCN